LEKNRLKFDRHYCCLVDPR